jgi:hypothetical protein
MRAGTPIQVRLQGEELAALDRRRREQPNPPSRGSELRKLIRAVLLDAAPLHNEGDHRTGKIANQSMIICERFQMRGSAHEDETCR